MTKRLGKSTGDWVSVPISELVTDRQASGTLRHEVAELDERFEYMFHLCAKWVDVPACLGGQEWTPEITSSLLSMRLQELRLPEAPIA